MEVLQDRLETYFGHPISHENYPDRTTPCWYKQTPIEWGMGKRVPHMQVDGKNTTLLRAAFTFVLGKAPSPTWHLRSLCPHDLCINPHHYEIVPRFTMRNGSPEPIPGQVIAQQIKELPVVEVTPADEMADELVSISWRSLSPIEIRTKLAHYSEEEIQSGIDYLT